MPVVAACGFFLSLTPLLALLLLGTQGVSALLANPAWHAALARTLRLAAVSAPLGVLLGLVAARLLRMLPRGTKPVFCTLCLLPALVPVALLLPPIQAWAGLAGPAARDATLLVCHTLPAFSLAFLLLALGRRRIDPRLLASVRASGGSAFTAWRLVSLPDIACRFAAACVAAFAVAIGLTMADTGRVGAVQPSFGAMLAVAMKTADEHVAAAGLILAMLTVTPVLLLGGVSSLRHR